jgi:GMP synthase-like glutamine amidotransferase
MRVHYLQHVPFEGPAAVQDWSESRGHVLTGTELFQEPPTEAAPATPEHLDAFPALDEIDLLVIMGGPMGVYDYARYPWLQTEKAFIQAAIGVEKAVLGICLGAQLIADVLGGPVTKNAHAEIGWYPVELTDAGRAEPLFADFPDTFTALHWHGDTFAIPPGATHAASSAACANQAFSLDEGRVVGLQFHLEETPASLAVLVEHAAAELDAASTEPWIATQEDLVATDAPYEPCGELLFQLLDRMAARSDRDRLESDAR